MTSAMRPDQTVGQLAGQLPNDLWAAETLPCCVFFLRGLPVWAQRRKGRAEGPRDMGEKPFPDSDPELLSLSKQPARLHLSRGGCPSLLPQWTPGSLSNILGRKYGGMKAGCKIC